MIVSILCNNRLMTIYTIHVLFTLFKFATYCACRRLRLCICVRICLRLCARLRVHVRVHVLSCVLSFVLVCVCVVAFFYVVLCLFVLLLWQYFYAMSYTWHVYCSFSHLLQCNVYSSGVQAYFKPTDQHLTCAPLLKTYIIFFAILDNTCFA